MQFKSVVQIDDILKNAIKAFDYEFDGTSTFELPNYNLPIRDNSWNIGLIVGSSGSGKTKLLETHYKYFHSNYTWNKAIVSHFNTFDSIEDLIAELPTTIQPKKEKKVMKELSQGTLVEFNYGGLQGTGTIVGLVHTYPIVGGTYIIAPHQNIVNETYKYTHFVCPECNLKIIDLGSK
jgi:energy-coupling factor transporter ATP-binding protein EcfA2